MGYQSPYVQIGAQFETLQLCGLWKKRSAVKRIFGRMFHCTGAAPASSSSHRGHPGVLRPNTGPPQLCLVVVLFVHAIGVTFLCCFVVPLYTWVNGYSIYFLLVSIQFRE